MAFRLCKLATQAVRLYSGGNIGGLKKLSPLDKRVMVIGGGFKSVKDVPDEVPPAQFLKSKEKFRIKLNIAAIFLTLGACLWMINLGQKDSEAGNSFHKQVLDKHAKLKGNESKEA